ncbi:MAG: tRNA pseudouridine(55) synthase TruB [Clostridia bacterium]|nr:tRNA pseudouridine(55) synthase TruB [Clostridia bacterium]
MENISGIIIINKEKEYTSHDVVAKVKKILNISKVGHTGTLDPNATGVLPLLLNDGTKLSKYLINHDKEYKVTLKLGIKTDTADGEGNVVEERNVEFDELNSVEETLNSFIGKQEQVPPIYSAIKVKGKKLYEYAREGKNVEIAPRKIEIYNIKLEKINKETNEIEFIVECSKGTYIRSLCEDVATRLGTIGYMKELERIKVGEFEISKAITINDLENNIENLDKYIITMEELLKDYPEIIVKNKEQKLFLNGVNLKTDQEDGLYRIYFENETEFVGTRNSK